MTIAAVQCICSADAESIEQPLALLNLTVEARWEKCGRVLAKQTTCLRRAAMFAMAATPPFVSPAAVLTAQAGTGGIQQAIIDKINLEAEETRQEETGEQNTRPAAAVL